jgi:hypothetical protein
VSAGPGVDVLTDTGFYADRLAAMSANPWSYGGNWESPYVYTRNNPANLVDPSGLQWEWAWYYAFCKSVCNTAAKDPKLSRGGGGVFCKDGIKCVCLFDYPLAGGGKYEVGKCPSLDACGRQHEVKHMGDVDCPKGTGITRPPFRRGIDTTARECELRKLEASCMEKALVGLKNANKNGCNDICIGIGETDLKSLKDWINRNC